MLKSMYNIHTMPNPVEKYTAPDSQEHETPQDYLPTALAYDKSGRVLPQHVGSVISARLGLRTHYVDENVLDRLITGEEEVEFDVRLADMLDEQEHQEEHRRSSSPEA